MILGGKNCAVCHGKMHTVCGRQLGGDNWICNQCDLAEPTTNTVPVPIAGYALVVRKAGGQTVVLKPTLAVLRSANAVAALRRVRRRRDALVQRRLCRARIATAGWRRVTGRQRCTRNSRCGHFTSRRLTARRAR